MEQWGWRPSFLGKRSSADPAAGRLGNAPRKALASKAARKSAPATRSFICELDGEPDDASCDCSVSSSCCSVSSSSRYTASARARCAPARPPCRRPAPRPSSVGVTIDRVRSWEPPSFYLVRKAISINDEWHSHEIIAVTHSSPEAADTARQGGLGVRQFTNMCLHRVRFVSGT